MPTSTTEDAHAVRRKVDDDHNWVISDGSVKEVVVFMVVVALAVVAIAVPGLLVSGSPVEVVETEGEVVGVDDWSARDDGASAALLDVGERDGVVVATGTEIVAEEEEEEEEEECIKGRVDGVDLDGVVDADDDEDDVTFGFDSDEAETRAASRTPVNESSAPSRIFSRLSRGMPPPEDESSSILSRVASAREISPSLT